MNDNIFKELDRRILTTAGVPVGNREET